MKIRAMILWVIVLVLIDSAIKIIINGYFLNVRFEIIPNLFEFRPKFNDHYSYVNHLFGLGMGFWTHIIIMCIASIIALVIYDFFRTIPDRRKMLDIAFLFCFSGIICALIADITGGCLDYIYLKPLFIFDLKDLYSNCFLILFYYYLIRNRKAMKSIKLKDQIDHFKNRFKSLTKSQKS